MGTTLLPVRHLQVSLWIHWPPCWQGKEQIPPSQLRPWKPAGQSHTPEIRLEHEARICFDDPRARELGRVLHLAPSSCPRSCTVGRRQAGCSPLPPNLPDRRTLENSDVLIGLIRLFDRDLPNESQVPRLWHCRSHCGWGPSARHSFLA